MVIQYFIDLIKYEDSEKVLVLLLTMLNRRQGHNY
jgi:hypothetical protein